MSPLASATLQHLFAAISKKGDLPSISGTLSRIVASMSGEEGNDQNLVDAVLSDFALTQKVLRLANSAMYSSFGGTVTTVSKAVYILGTETVGHLAMGLKLLDNLGQAAESQQAAQELCKAVMSGVVARQVGASLSGRDGEEAAVATLLRSLGKLLVCFYLPSAFAQVESLTTGPDDEDQMATRVLGLSYADLASAVATKWKLPSELTVYVHEDPQGEGHVSWLHAVVGYSRRYITAVSQGADAGELTALARRYADAVGLPEEALVATAQQAVTSAEADEAQAAATAGLRRARAAAQAQRSAQPAATSSAAPTTSRPAGGLQRLKQGVAEVQSLESKLNAFKLTQLTGEVLLDALGCTRVLFFLRRPADKCYAALAGLGQDAARHVRALRFEEAFSPNVFHIALSSGNAVYLADAHEPNIARRIPSWYREALGDVRTLMLLPVGAGRQPAGLFYLDWGSEGRDKALDAATLACIDQLRDSLHRAFQSSRPALQAAAPSAAAVHASV